MTPDDSKIIQAFILQFLPMIETRRRYSHNEFSYVYQCLRKIFSHYSNIKFSEQELLECFGHAGYIALVSNKPPIGKSKILGSSTAFLQQLRTDYYLNIRSSSVTRLNKATSHLARFKNPETISALMSLRRDLKLFFSNHLTPKPWLLAGKAVVTGR